MSHMNTYERMKRMYAHQEADRIPIVDVLWDATRERWELQGLPAGMDFADYFDIDHIPKITTDNSFRFEESVIEETEDYIIKSNVWGSTFKNWKHRGSTPECLDYTVTDASKWFEVKNRMAATPDRIPWDYLKTNYKKWREKGYWVRGRLFFGFDVAHSFAVGTERFLIALLEEPEWCIDMFNHYLDTSLALLQMV